MPLAWLAAGVGLVAVLAVAVLSLRGGDEAPAAVQVDAELSVLRTADFHSMAISPQDPNLVLYGHHGGVLRSGDGGRSWKATSLTGQADDAMGMGFAGADGKSVFAAGHGTFFRSSDAGRTWENLEPNLPKTDLHGLATAPDEPGTVYVHVVGAGIYSSADSGVTWRKASQAALPGDIIGLSAGPGGRLYAASPGGGILRSDDGGRTFGPAGKLDTPLTVSASSGPGDIVYAGTETGLFFSDDGGQRWQSRTLPAAGAVLVSAVSPDDAMEIAVVVVGEDGAGRVLRSADGGVTWMARQ